MSDGKSICRPYSQYWSAFGFNNFSENFIVTLDADSILAICSTWAPRPNLCAHEIRPENLRTMRSQSPNTFHAELSPAQKAANVFSWLECNAFQAE